MSTVVWTGTCSKCGEKAELPFVPRNTSFVFCSDCKRKNEQEQQGKTMTKHNQGQQQLLPINYLSSGYFDESKKARREIILDEAQKAAKVLAHSDLAAVKLMGLYNKARILREKYKNKKDFDEIKVDLRMMLIDAVDSTGRGVTPDVYRQFVEKNILLAEMDPLNFANGFVEHLKCVRAWFLYERRR